MYQSDRSYWLPGVTLGAQTVSSVIIALRSPSTRRVSDTFMALVPECASATVSKVKSLSPQPDFSQQAGMSRRRPAVSKPGLVIRLAPADAGCGADISSAAVIAPTPSSAAGRLRLLRIVGGMDRSLSVLSISRPAIGEPAAGRLPAAMRGHVLAPRSCVREVRVPAPDSRPLRGRYTSASVAAKRRTNVVSSASVVAGSTARPSCPTNSAISGIRSSRSALASSANRPTRSAQCRCPRRSRNSSTSMRTKFHSTPNWLATISAGR